MPSSAVPTTLDTLKPGDQARVLRLSGEASTTERLMEMGLTPGATIKVLKFAPMGDPIELLVRGYHLSLRRADAADIEVELPAS